ncbi:uncharacterized protein PGTG_15589 [Puccinia graminis f. sp. tritici CRL 75-36-700-3]|uniref:Uncharacterized protein n=1 Tax=Puccinia graminis f. sp. tritici (strain CRL 75-36-700-3 / race SCCL) TaxID=418459 RepID=E3KZA1_PUCGT|nr:uncharacterized protein PGTG_15589 [Puccinia graminis f. sp. tritici CRL 75-36-700-3]EFP89626.2 hypothetical protein PGTG_15589 [Puccinia graminis f. sp. tritici CRL 75-36-700-3]
MSIENESESAACFLSLSQKLSDIFKLTSDRLNQISDSLSSIIDSQPSLLLQLNPVEFPNQSSRHAPLAAIRTEINHPSQLAAQPAPFPSATSEPLPGPRSDNDPPSLQKRDKHGPVSNSHSGFIPDLRSADLNGQKKLLPCTPPTLCEALPVVSDHVESEGLAEIRNPSSCTPPPPSITPRRLNPEGLVIQDDPTEDFDQAPSVHPNQTENGPVLLNLRERIASPPSPVAVGPALSNSSNLAQRIDPRSSQSAHSSPMDMRDSDPPKEVTPNDRTRPVSPATSSYRRLGDSSYDYSSRTGSSSRRRSRTPSSRSSNQRYRPDSRPSSLRRDSIPRQTSRRPNVYDSYKPGGPTRARRPRSRSLSRRSRSPSRRSPSPSRRSPSPSRRSSLPSRRSSLPRRRSPSPSRRSPSPRRRSPSPRRRSHSPRRRSPSPRRRSPSPSRLPSERLGSKRPSNARFIDRIESREDRDFAEYLDSSRGRPSYDRLKSLLRTLSGPNHSELVVSRHLWETFHRFRHRTDTREEQMLRHLHLYPELMHPFLTCARERHIVTYRPIENSLSKSTVKLDVSCRSPVPR